MIAFLSLSFSTIFLIQLVAAQTCTPCDDVHFFLARGNNEPYPGRQGDLVAATCDGISSCGYENLIYSALYTDLSCQTTYDGTLAGHTQLTAYAERCPDSKLILAGYSQGAQIVTDILGGGGGVSFNGCVQPNTAPLDRTKSPGNRLSAVLAVGNTRHTANQPYNYGNGSSMDGLFPKSGTQLTNIAAYADIMRDWCLSPDPICAANQTYSNVNVHLGYYNSTTGYVPEMVSFIRSVASLKTDSNFRTAIPTYVSGTVQDYKTVGTATPSGTVKTAATTTAVVQCGSSTSSRTSSRSSASASASGTSSAASDAGVEGATTSAPAASASASDSASAAVYGYEMNTMLGVLGLLVLPVFL